MDLLTVPAAIPELSEKVRSGFLAVGTASEGGSDADSGRTSGRTAELTDGASALTVDLPEIAQTVLDAAVAVVDGAEDSPTPGTPGSVGSVVIQVGDQFTSIDVPALALQSGSTPSLPRTDTEDSDDDDLQLRAPLRRNVFTVPNVPSKQTSEAAQPGPSATQEATQGAPPQSNETERSSPKPKPKPKRRGCIIC